MVIHTKEKAKIHAHEPKGAKIKGSNIYTVERGPKVHDAKANEMDKKASAKLMLQKSAGGKRTYRKSTIHQSEAKDKGLSRFKRNIRESGTSIKTKNTNLHIAGRTGVLAAGAVTEQVEGGYEVSQAAYLAYEASQPVTGTASKGAALFRKKAAAEAKKRIKKVEAGKKLAKKTAKKAAKDTAKTVAKETAKETAKTTAKVATKTATKAAATAAGTAVAPGVGTAIGMAAGYAAGVSIEVKDEKMTNRSRKIKFFLDKMKAQENQTDSVAKLVKDLIVRKAITWVKAAAPIIGLVLLLLVLVVAMIAVPVIAVIAILYNSPFALFLPPLESGDTVQTVTSAYVQEFNRDVNTKVNEHTGYDLGEEDTLVNNAKKALSEAQERLNSRCEHIKSQVLEVKEQVRSTAKGIVEKAKEKGRAALYRVSEFLGIKKRLLDIRENVRGAIKTTDKDIAKTALLAKEFREAGQTAANAFRTFADKPEVDYSQKEQKHPITKAVLAPMKAVKKMLVSMKLHLDASIDKLDNLAIDVRMDKEKHMENAKVQEQTEPERAEAERVEAEIVYSPMVAEPQEYQYNADAFEARGVDEVKQEAAHKEVSKVREDKAR